MTRAFLSIRTQDGTVLARDLVTGQIASGRTLLRRLTASHAHTCEARRSREGIAA